MTKGLIALGTSIVGTSALVPDFDATIVTRALDAGATVIGKNMLNGFAGVGGPSGSGWVQRTAVSGSVP